MNDNAKKTAFVQDHLLTKGKHALDKVNRGIAQLKRKQELQSDSIDAFDAFLDDVDNFLENDSQDSFLRAENFYPNPRGEKLVAPRIEIIDSVEFNQNASAEEFYSVINQYALSHNIKTTRPLYTLLSYNEIEQLKVKIERDFTYQQPKCDKYDYLIAGVCGAIGALIDIFGVGEPGSGFLGKLTDSFFDSSVEKIASWAGWPGATPGSNPTQSAIGWLERHYSVPYDHATTAATGGLVKNLSMSNHHIKSLAHSPDPIGLLFSIIDQFYCQGSFIDRGKLIIVKSTSSESFELQGNNAVAKIYSAFVNWFMHLVSDMAGSSGAKGRGSGIPAPFQNLLGCLNLGSFGQYHHDLGTIFTKVFEQGYDFRHGTALAIPVIVTELLIRLLYTLRKGTNKGLEEISSHNSPELQRMLFVGQGILCLGDVIDAYVRSGGELIKFLTRTNLIAWARFGTLAYKEFVIFVNSGHIKVKELDAYIEQQYKAMIY